MANRRNNLMSFLDNVFEGTGHKMLSKTNRRAHSWIENHALSNGPCVTFLNDCITKENLVTIDQMNLFKNLEERGDLPDESEIDAMLADYLGEEVSTVDVTHIHLSSSQDELARARKYYQTLDEEEKVLRQQCDKLQKEICPMKSTATTSVLNKRENVCVKAANDVNDAYNKSWEQIQRKLSNVPKALSTLLASDEYWNEYLIPAPSAKNMKIFREAVGALIQKHFADTAVNPVVTIDKQAKATISAVENLGQLEYERLKLDCEKVELKELDRFIEKTSKDVDVFNTRTFIDYLRTRIGPGLTETDAIQRKIIGVSQRLEELSTEAVVKKMFLAYREQSSERTKSTLEFMKNVAHDCAKFADLLTLLACLANTKLMYIDFLFALVDIARQKLVEHREQHLSAVMKLRKLLPDEAELFKAPAVQLIEKDIPSNASYDNHPKNKEKDEIFSFVRNFLETYSALQRDLNEIDSLIFNGPVRSKIFFCRSLKNDHVLLERQYDQISEQFELCNAQYRKKKQENEQQMDDEWNQSYKNLGWTFLTSSNVLRRSLKQLRDQASRTITIVQSTSNEFCEHPEADTKKGNYSLN